MDLSPLSSSSAAFSDAEKEALYRIMRTRRDIRHFVPTPLPPDVVRRILEMAHCAPSVGFMQPWNFLIVRSREHPRFEELLDRYTARFTDDFAAAMPMRQSPSE